MRIAVAAPAYLERRGSPRHHDDLTSHDCIVHRVAAGSSEWRLTGSEGPVVVGVRGAVSSNVSHAVREAALWGLGIALLPEYLVATDIQSGALRRVLPDYTFADLPVFVVYTSRRYMAPRTRIVLDFLVEELHWLRRRRTDYDAPAAPPGAPLFLGTRLIDTAMPSSRRRPECLCGNKYLNSLMFPMSINRQVM